MSALHHFGIGILAALIVGLICELGFGVHGFAIYAIVWSVAILTMLFSAWLNDRRLGRR